MERRSTNDSGSIWGCRLRSNTENVREEGRLMALFHGALTSQPIKQLPENVTSGCSFLPSAKMAAEARPYHGARAVPPVFPLPVLPRAGNAHSTAAFPPLPASSASPPFWLLPPVQAPSPEVDIAARLRGRGGGGSTSGGTGPGLVFVNLPRSRQGSGGQGVGTVRWDLEEAPRGGGDCGRPRLAGRSTPQGAQRRPGRRQRLSSSQAVRRRAGRGRGRKEGRVAKGGGSPERGRGPARARAHRSPPASLAASPARRRGFAWRGRGREHAPRAHLGALLRLRAVGRCGRVADWQAGGGGGRGRAAPASVCLPSTSAASFRTFGRTRRTRTCGPARRTLPVRLPPAAGASGDSRRAFLHPGSGLLNRVRGSRAGPLGTKAPRGLRPLLFLRWQIRAVGLLWFLMRGPNYFYSCWQLLFAQETSFYS